MTRKRGKPVLYMGTSEKSLAICAEKGITVVYVNLYGAKKVSDMKEITTPEGFTQVVSGLAFD